MSILKYKYKAHKFINYAFYIVVFIFGFLLGFTTQKIDFNKLISQVLMIDSVSAYNFENKYTTIDNLEEHIYNSFTTAFDDFDIKEYSNINCKISADNKSIIYMNCLAFNDSALNDFYYTIHNNNWSYRIKVNNSISYYKLQYAFIEDGEIVNKVINNSSVTYFKENEDFQTFNNRNFNVLTNNDTVYGNYTFTNYDINHEDFSGFNSSINVLDFAGTNLQFNENLFKDNPDFKEVCVNSSTRFAITSNNITYNDDTELKYFNGIDFIWFSYVPEGLSTYLYSDEVEDKVVILTEEGPLFNGINPGNWYYLNKKSEIDKFFNTNSSNGEIYPGTILEHEGYINKYSYFGWYFHPFVVHLDNTSDGGNYFSVFHFKDNINFYSILENGLDYYEELENARKDNICFYIKNQYDIVILEKDVFGDDIGETIILGGDKLNINTSYNYSNLDSKGLFSKINLFINKIKDTIVFINNYIYELYTSMPYIVQLFIISIFGLIVVRILIGMVTR